MLKNKKFILLIFSNLLVISGIVLFVLSEKDILWGEFSFYYLTLTYFLNPLNLVIIAYLIFIHKKKPLRNKLLIIIAFIVIYCCLAFSLVMAWVFSPLLNGFYAILNLFGIYVYLKYNSHPA
jgi:uncharacterized membrane protein SirB2